MPDPIHESSDPNHRPPQSNPGDTFDLAPEDPAAPPREARPSHAGPKPAIAAPGLTEGFDEDADFEKDPEVDRALGRSGFHPRDAAEPAPAGEDFIKPGLGDAPVIALVGLGVLLSAVITAWITAPSRGWAHALLTGYSTLLHAGSGVGALAIAAKLAEQRLGKWELGAARMLLAVALFQLVVHLNLPGGAWVKSLGAVAVYAGATLLLFRLKIEQWFIVASSHLAIWLVIEGLVWLNTLVEVAPKAPAP